MKCWVCGAAIESGEPHVAATGVPARYRKREGQPIHLRCQGEWGEVTRRRRERRQAEACAVPPDTPRWFYAEDVAGLRGISHRQAARWLRQLEERHGATVVGQVAGRRGPRRYTTAAGLELIGPATERDVAALPEVVDDLAKRVTALEQRALGENAHSGQPDRLDRPIVISRIGDCDRPVGAKRRSSW